jgi:hypothetical protein
LGQKYYPIKYNLRKFFFYLLISLAIFFICKGIAIESQTLKLIVHNLLILGFVGIAWVLEKPSPAVAK